jgi:hypothetical protein
VQPEAEPQPQPQPVPVPVAVASRLSSLFSSLFGFGRNPSARELHRRPAATTTVIELVPGGMQVTSETKLSQTVQSEDGEDEQTPQPPAMMMMGDAPRRGGWFSSMVDALFGPTPSPMEDSDPLMSAMSVPPPPPPNRWWGWRPSLFRSLLGPGPQEVMTDSSASGAASDDGDAQPQPQPQPVVVMDGAGEEDGWSGPGMHRSATGSRLGKLFNRVLRFFHRRPVRTGLSPLTCFAHSSNG